MNNSRLNLATTLHSFFKYSYIPGQNYLFTRSGQKTNRGTSILNKEFKDLHRGLYMYIQIDNNNRRSDS